MRFEFNNKVLKAESKKLINRLTRIGRVKRKRKRR